MNQNSCSSNRGYMSNQSKITSSCNSAIDTIMSSNSDCGCKDNNHHMHHMPLAMAYVPMQKWRNIYEADVGLDRGTMFCELDLPFLGDRRDGK